MESEEINEARTTATLLGYIDVAIDAENKPYAGDSVIGGEPVAMDARSPIPEKLLVCGHCGGLMRQLVQCSADVPGTWYERSLYVLACVEVGCRRQKGSVRAIRGVKKDPAEMARREEAERAREEAAAKAKAEAAQREAENKQKAMGLFGKKEGAGANPFGANPFASTSANPFASNSNPFEMKSVEKAVEKADKKEEGAVAAEQTYAAIAKGHMTKPVEREADHIKLPSFPGYILYFDPEELDPKKQYLPPLPADVKIEEVDEMRDNVSVTSGNLSKVNNDRREDVARMVDDPTFQNFASIVSYNTGQVLRYELGGEPLLYSSKDDVAKVFYDAQGKLRKESDWKIPAPGYNPSGRRRFEVQLMPKMIIDLEKDADMDMLREGMEWGTIVVATDADDTVPDNWLDERGVAYMEEWAGVQWEEEVAPRG